MATLSCPQHGPAKDTEKFCAVCMEFLVPLVEQPATTGLCVESGCGTRLVDGLCPVHGIDAPRPQATGVDTGRDGPTLHFPWGPVAVTGARVTVGRSAECAPLAAHIDAGYPNVSRVHAVVWCRDGGLWVIDRDSLNGTYVNGRRLDPGAERRLADGDELRFAADLRVTVRVPGERP